MNEREKTRRRTMQAAFIGINAALVLAVSFCEQALTAALPLPPGVKPGLSNIVVMFLCFTAGLFPAMVTAVIKSAFIAVISGVTSGFISLCGGILSVLSLWICKKISKEKLSFVGISIISAVMHNSGQLIAASITVGSGLYLAYAPVLLISGIFFGSVTGIILNTVMPALIKISDKLK